METSFTPVVGMDWGGPCAGRQTQSGESFATICLPLGCQRFPLCQSLRFWSLDIVCDGCPYLLLAVSSFLGYLPAGGGRSLRSPPSAGDCPVLLLVPFRVSITGSTYDPDTVQIGVSKSGLKELLKFITSQYNFRIIFFPYDLPISTVFDPYVDRKRRNKWERIKTVRIFIKKIL
jgi:hypothetical protein